MRCSLKRIRKESPTTRLFTFTVLFTILKCFQWFLRSPFSIKKGHSARFMSQLNIKHPCTLCGPCGNGRCRQGWLEWEFVGQVWTVIRWCVTAYWSGVRCYKMMLKGWGGGAWGCRPSPDGLTYILYFSSIIQVLNSRNVKKYSKLMISLTTYTGCPQMVHPIIIWFGSFIFYPIPLKKTCGQRLFF